MKKSINNCSKYEYCTETKRVFSKASGKPMASLNGLSTVRIINDQGFRVPFDDVDLYLEGFSMEDKQPESMIAESSFKRWTGPLTRTVEYELEKHHFAESQNAIAPEQQRFWQIENDKNYLSHLKRMISIAKKDYETYQRRHKDKDKIKAMIFNRVTSGHMTDGSKWTVEGAWDRREDHAYSYTKKRLDELMDRLYEYYDRTLDFSSIDKDELPLESPVNLPL